MENASQFLQSLFHPKGGWSANPRRGKPDYEAPLGHGDFPGSRGRGGPFDFTAEDYGPNSWKRNPAVHFQDYWQSEEQVEAAIEACEIGAYQAAMHRMQDYWTHWAKGFRWDPKNRQFGHAGETPNPDHDLAAWREAQKATAAFNKLWFANCCFCKSKNRWQKKPCK